MELAAVVISGVFAGLAGGCLLSGLVVDSLIRVTLPTGSQEVRSSVSAAVTAVGFLSLPSVLAWLTEPDLILLSTVITASTGLFFCLLTVVIYVLNYRKER